jgi:hypothetical protein
MSFRIFASWGRTRAERPTAKPKVSYFRPVLEGFEDRVVPAAPSVNAGLVAPADAVVGVNNITITDVDVDLADLAIIDGVLTLAEGATATVSGTIVGLPFVAEITDFALDLLPDDPTTPGTECAVLDLALGPINLNLLGLHVDTTPICLSITATEGGGLLGDLLCSLAGGGIGGLPILPTADQLGQLLDGLLDLLNGVLNSSPAGPGGGGTESVCTGESHILELAIGPLDLSLLGLNVFLDDCNNGPVQICVSATASEGLLGSLLAGLGSTPSSNLDLADITQFAETAQQLLEDGDLSGRDRGQLTSLLARLRR